jgi:hypothetical protein
MLDSAVILLPLQAVSAIAAHEINRLVTTLIPFLLVSFTCAGVAGDLKSDRTGDKSFNVVAPARQRCNRYKSRLRAVIGHIGSVRFLTFGRQLPG